MRCEIRCLATVPYANIQQSMGFHFCVKEAPLWSFIVDQACFVIRSTTYPVVHVPCTFYFFNTLQSLHILPMLPPVLSYQARPMYFYAAEAYAEFLMRAYDPPFKLEGNYTY